jgi:hypothetical protein
MVSFPGQFEFVIFSIGLRAHRRVPDAVLIAQRLFDLQADILDSHRRSDEKFLLQH